jgi:cytoskeleton protein RodZ
MASRIGSDLRRARTRREIELSEVEAATRIRSRFLRAIEREEWDVLPGGVYTRGFIRTYANFLGLDGDRLADDYRHEVEDVRRPEAAAAPIPPSKRNAGLRASPLPLVLAVGGVILVAVVAILAIPSGGGGGGTDRQPAAQRPSRQTGDGEGATGVARSAESVSMRLTAKAEVWVCVLGPGGRRLVDGQILEAGSVAGPFHSDSFTISFGNGEVTMTIDGKQAEIPATSSPIGYSIDSSGALTELSEAERPTCA